MTSGTQSVTAHVASHVAGYASAAVTSGDYLTEMVAPFRAVLGGIQARAETAGSGSGSTVLDVLVNGTSIWTQAGARPTLAAAGTGGFALSAPPTTAVQPGDSIAIQVAGTPGGAGHARVQASVALEHARQTT